MWNTLLNDRKWISGLLLKSTLRQCFAICIAFRQVRKWKHTQSSGNEMSVIDTCTRYQVQSSGVGWEETWKSLGSLPAQMFGTTGPPCARKSARRSQNIRQSAEPHALCLSDEFCFWYPDCSADSLCHNMIGLNYRLIDITQTLRLIDPAIISITQQLSRIGFDGEEVGRRCNNLWFRTGL